MLESKLGPQEEYYMLLTMEPYLFNFCMRMCAHKVSVECLLYSLSIFFVCVFVCF